MEFGYFTLSDNHYDNNPRAPNQFVADITAEALYADSSACIRPGSASIISIRSACCPAPTSCWPISRRAPSTSGSRPPSRCCRCTIRSASPSNGRRSTCSATAASISPPGAATTGANTRRSMSSFEDNQCIFEEGLELVRKLWAADDRISHKGKHYSFEDVRITPKPVQKPIPTYVGVVLQALDRARGAARLRPDRRAVRRRDELRRAEAGRRPLSTRPAPSTARSPAG